MLGDRQIATSVDDTQDQRVLAFDPVQDCVAADREAPEARRRSLRCRPACGYLPSSANRSVIESINRSRFDAAGLAEDVVRDVVEIGFRLRREAVGH